jgi:membrane-bound lytic murein transglycosylase MltF
LGQPAAFEDLEELPLIQRITERATGDFSEMRQRRLVRVLVSPSRTSFFIDSGRPRGFECELMLEYEKFLNKGVKRGDKHIHVVFVPVQFSDLFLALLDGRGDIAAAGLTVTAPRLEKVAFTDPYLSEVTEIVVANRHLEPLHSIEDLAGRTVYIVENSSYAQHLQALNKRWAGEGRRPVKIVHPGPSLATEDILEMVNAGIFDLTVIDRHVAELWSGVLPDLNLYRELAINTGGRIAWAVRQESSELLANLNAFIAEHKKGTLLGNIFFKRYFENTKWVRNPLTGAEQKKLEQYVRLLRRYSEHYGFDWLLMAAQAYQESGLDQSARSKAGAIGLMQVRPKTAAELGFPSVKDPENNIHAGIKYMHRLRENHFSDPEIPAAVRCDFTLAAYNAGPARVARWRKLASERGLDSNRWFSHVERVALEVTGPEPVRYVGNVNKYYVAYKLLYAAEQERSRERARSE